MNNQYVYEVKKCNALSESVSEIVLQAVDAPLIYQAGQYIKVVHDDGSVSPLSVSCAPISTAMIELHLSHAKTNSQAQDILKSIKEKNSLILRGPYGTCTLDRFSLDKPVIFLAGGTGFAPVKSLIEAMQQLHTNPVMHLYWGESRKNEFYLQELIQGWQQQMTHFSFTPVLKNVDPLWLGKTGLLQEAVLEDYSDLSGYQVYASGPEKLIYAALKAFEVHGLKKEKFYSDVFDYVILNEE